LHWNGLHVVAAGAAHWPAALHMEAPVYEALLQVSAAQVVPTGYF
jgi:hypothetical protein